jgi:hypothetical protein
MQRRQVADKAPDAIGGASNDDRAAQIEPSAWQEAEKGRRQKKKDEGRQDEQNEEGRSVCKIHRRAPYPGPSGSPDACVRRRRNRREFGKTDERAASTDCAKV